MNIAAVILAAGSSSRMGSPKQLLEFQGESLLRRAARTALSSKCSRVIVVLGSEDEQVGQALNNLDVIRVLNHSWREGMGTSIHAGAQAAIDLAADGLLLTLSDQPLITAQILNHLIEEHLRTTRPIVASQYQGTVGVPVFFHRDYFPALLALAPQHGCKGLILASLEEALRIDCPEASIDIDTPEDYKNITSSR